VQLQFFRLRFHFETVDPILFPSGTAANTVRGALGSLLRETACTPGCSAAQHDAECVYARIFEPRGSGPSGFADRPRPFVLRTHHLDGRPFGPGENFFFDVHLFDPTNPVLPYFIQALSRLADEGIGAGRKRARLHSVEQITLAGGGCGSAWDGGEIARMPEPCTLALIGDGIPATTARVRFVTPTELKFQNMPATRPEFAVLFARIRDRVSALSSFYGPVPLDIDFRAMGERASRVEMTRCELHDEHARRRSSRTGQLHPLGGFTGEAEYRGDLAEFLPYLRAARWTGVGRQTVWGKGEMHLLEVIPSN
jgi:CRISPR-associated endoribonuclease Cas6